MNETPLAVDVFDEPSVVVPLNNEVLFDQIADALHTDGHIVLPAVLPSTITSSITSYIQGVDDSRLKQAGIGRESDLQVNEFVRSDEILWLDKEQKALAPYFEWIEALRLGLNRRLFMGLFDFECHYARYQQGAFYKKHVDAFRGQRSRVVTVIIYLNDSWQVQDGGELVMYTPDDTDVLMTVSPTFGKAVVFLSEEFPHEVLTTQRERISVTGWFRVNNNQDSVIDPAQ